MLQTTLTCVLLVCPVCNLQNKYRTSCSHNEIKKMKFSYRDKVLPVCSVKNILTTANEVCTNSSQITNTCLLMIHTCTSANSIIYLAVFYCTRALTALLATSLRFTRIYFIYVTLYIVLPGTNLTRSQLTLYIVYTTVDN